MAKRYAPPNSLPAHYEREYLDEPVPCRFRRINDTDGRGDNWMVGKVHAYDHHSSSAPVVYSKEGGWRTLDLTIWEIQ